MADVNTKNRWDSFCREKHSDGRVCSLYAPHEGLHKAKNDLEDQRWETGA